MAAEAAAEAVEAEAVAESEAVEAPAAAAAADSELSVVVMNDYEQWRTLPGIVLSAGPLPQLQQKGLGAHGHSYHASIYMPVKSDWLVRVPRERTGRLLGEHGKNVRVIREMSGCKLFVEKNAKDRPLRNVWLSGLEDQKAWAEHAVLKYVDELRRGPRRRPCRRRPPARTSPPLLLILLLPSKAPPREAHSPRRPPKAK